MDIGQRAAPAAILQIADQLPERTRIRADRPCTVERGAGFSADRKPMGLHRARKTSRAPAAALLDIRAARRTVRGKDDGRESVTESGEMRGAPHESSGLSPPAPASLSASSV